MSFNMVTQGLICIREWIADYSDIVIAIATVAIAFFTYTLWRATSGMFKVSQEQSRDMKSSIAISQKAADAAKKSADALPAMERAYLFVKVWMDRPVDIIIGTQGNLGKNQAGIFVINHGKTPAILIKFPFITKILKDAEIDNYLLSDATIISNPLIPSGTELINSGEEIIFPAYFFIDKEEIKKDYKFVCVGCIHYEDVFGETHKTVFCWDYVWFKGFHPDKNPKRNYRT